MPSEPKFAAPDASDLPPGWNVAAPLGVRFYLVYDPEIMSRDDLIGVGLRDEVADRLIELARRVREWTERGTEGEPS